MVVDAEARLAGPQADNARGGGPLFKATRDPRVTRMGRILRAMSTDELPQLFNVFSGRMSLVALAPPCRARLSNSPIASDCAKTSPGASPVSGRSNPATLLPRLRAVRPLLRRELVNRPGYCLPHDHGQRGSATRAARARTAAARRRGQSRRRTE